MFINEKILRKLMIKAYKGNGLYMHRECGYYYLADEFNRSWEAKIAVGCVPKTIMGAMVECAGELPEDGEGWTSDKEKSQREAFLKWGAPDPECQTLEPVTLTPVLVMSPGGTVYHVLQLPNDVTICVTPAMWNAIDAAAVDRANGEGMIKGPFYDGDRGIVAYTDQAVWHAHAGRPIRTDEVMDILSEHMLRYDDAEERE